MALIKPLLRQVAFVQNVLYTTDWVASISYVPPVLEGNPFWMDRKQDQPYIFSFMVHSISLPQIQSNVGEVAFAGFRVRVPMEMPRSGELQLVFLEDQKAKVVRALMEWVKAIHDYRLNKRPDSESRGWNAYKSVMDIALHTHAATISPPEVTPPEVDVLFPIAYRLYGVWPTSISFPELTSQKTGDIFMVNASFSYDHFEVFTLSSGGNPL